METLLFPLYYKKIGNAVCGTLICTGMHTIENDLNTLKNHNLEKYFVTLNTADDGPGKPHPSMINRALSDTGVKNCNAFMIGYTTYDMQMAAQASVRSIGVTWGYHEKHELISSGANHIVNHISEIIELVNK